MKTLILALVGSMTFMNGSFAVTCPEVYQSTLTANARIRFIDPYNYKKQLEFFEGSHATVIINEVVLSAGFPIIGFVTAVHNSVTAHKRIYLRTMVKVLGEDQEKSEKALRKVYHWVYDTSVFRRIDQEKLAELRQAVEETTLDRTICPMESALALSPKGLNFIAPFTSPQEFLQAAHANGHSGVIHELFDDASNFTFQAVPKALQKNDLIQTLRTKLNIK